jgi:hypothetical protein
LLISKSAPDAYVEEAKDWHDAGHAAEDYHPYMYVYETVHCICQKQRNIIDKGTDLLILSPVFGALPLLTEMGLSFCVTAEEIAERPMGQDCWNMRLWG